MNKSSDVDADFKHFQLIANGPALFNAVATAIELDIFSFLSRHPNSEFDDVRRFVNIPAHKLRVLLLALCAAEVVNKRESLYSNTAVAEKFLSSDAPDSWRHIFIGAKTFYYPAFQHMTTALCTGSNKTALAEYPGAEDEFFFQRLAHDPELEATFHALTAALSLQAMEGLVENPEFSSVRHVLDVAGGDGTTARKLAERHTQARVTIFELPSVAKRADAAIPPHLANRVGVYPGDLLEDPFPDDVDAILFSNIIEGYSADRIHRVLSKSFDALPSGGKVLLYGINADDDERGGINAARLSLYANVLAQGDGMAYPAKDYRRWLERAGFTNTKSYTDLPHEHGLHVGTKTDGSRT